MKLLAKLFIPKNTPYCHHSFKEDKKGKISAKPCKYWCLKENIFGYKLEYCKYLKEYLSIQDQVKDCGINEDYDLENKGE